MLYSTWLVDLNDGPLWEQIMYQERDRCRSSWWSNILYINNYVNTDKLVSKNYDPTSLLLNRHQNFIHKLVITIFGSTYFKNDF